MYKCKYCGCKYQVEAWYRREEEHASTICPECHSRIDQIKGYCDGAKRIGKVLMGSLSSFIAERKRNLAAPSARIRISRNNDNGFDDILSLSESQWKRLTKRQLDSIMSRIEGDDVPGEVCLCVMKGIAWKSDDAKDYLRVAKIYAEGRASLGVARNINEAAEWYLNARAAKNADSRDMWYVEQLIKRIDPDALSKERANKRSPRISKLCMPRRK